jgi:hypothetical protein
MAKVFFLSKTTEGSTAANSLGVSAPVAGFVVVYSRSQQSGKTDMANIGLVYPMSKRTTLAWVNYDAAHQLPKVTLLACSTSSNLMLTQVS